jgi:hypothetical protein
LAIAPSGRRRRAALLFVGVFVFAVLIQLAFGWYERLASARSDLHKTADQIAQQLRYSNAWDLSRLRQSDLAGSYYIVDRSGMIIDIQGFVPDFWFDVDLGEWKPGLQRRTVLETNETWRLLVVPLRGGTLIMGASPPEDITRLDARLQENARRFGTSLEDAKRVSPSEIDRNLDFTILDRDGRILFAIGGIPLRLRNYPRSRPNDIEELLTATGSPYALFSVPFDDPSGKPVGTVTVVSDLPPLPWLSLRAWLINLSSSALVAFTGTLIGVRHNRDKFRPDDLLRSALDRGESSTVEFKSGLRWDQLQDAGTKPSVAEAVSVRAVAGFLNSKLGGTLLIGVADDKKVVGLDSDYKSLAKPGTTQDSDRDRFQLRLRQLVTTQIGRDVSNLCVETEIIPWENKDVCVVRVSPSPTPVYVGDGKAKAFYLRVGPSTQELNVEETVTFSRERWHRGRWSAAWRWTGLG